MGNPPINPDTTLPTPWAINSRLVGVLRFHGSSLSTASTFISVLSEAVTANVNAAR